MRLWKTIKYVIKRTNCRSEWLIYSMVWTTFLLAPFLAFYIRSQVESDLTFHWWPVFHVWMLFCVYLILFIIHNFALAPMLIYRKRVHLYVFASLVLICVFSILQAKFKQYEWKHFELGGRQAIQREDRSDVQHATAEFKTPEHPSIDTTESDILSVAMMLLIMGANTGVKFYFQSERRDKQLAQLTQEKLNDQLQHLRLQINPHFLMNTLNNIHALIGLDAAKAQTSIMELSRLLRFLLYDGGHTTIPLTKEAEFIRSYIHLLRLRYADRVEIRFEVGDLPDSYQMPPLILSVFVENAFKHGVSYDAPSFIHISLQVIDKRIVFKCANSKHEKRMPIPGGIGLENVKKRLQLIYGDDYHLEINDGIESYSVVLTIPHNKIFL